MNEQDRIQSRLNQCLADLGLVFGAAIHDVEAAYQRATERFADNMLTVRTAEERLAIEERFRTARAARDWLLTNPDALSALSYYSRHQVQRLNREAIEANLRAKDAQPDAPVPPVRTSVRQEGSASSWRELRGLLGSLGNLFLTVALLAASCYGPIHATNEHDSSLGWSMVFLPPLAWYWSAEGIIWHSDGAEEFCEVALTCPYQFPGLPRGQAACAAQVRTGLALSSNQERRQAEGLLREWSSLNCEQLKALESKLSNLAN